MEEIISNLENACNQLITKVDELVKSKQKAESKEDSSNFPSNEEIVKLQAQISKLSANNREALSKIDGLILKVKNLKKI